MVGKVTKDYNDLARVDHCGRAEGCSAQPPQRRHTAVSGASQRRGSSFAETGILTCLRMLSEGFA